MITVKNIIYSDPNYQTEGHQRTLAVLFSNNRYQSITIINSKGSPEDIADALIQLGHNILNDVDLK